jgi:TolA-binding protein
LILKDRVAGLESRIKEMQAEYERCQMENQINQEEAKSEYHIIAENHLS